MSKLNQAILRLMLLEGEDYKEIINKVRSCNSGSCEDKNYLLRFLKSEVAKCSKRITSPEDLEKFISDISD